MTKKECKRLAIKIAEAEKILHQNNIDEKQKVAARDTILYLSEKISDLKDMMLIDNYVQEILLDKNKIF